jgi:hypothetical protein
MGLSVKTKRVEGQATTTAAAPQPSIPLPQLPSDGNWTVKGRITASGPAPARKGVSWEVFFAGVCASGAATENDTSPPTTQPSDGGAAQGFQPAGVSVALAGRQAVIALAGIATTTITWSWDLEVFLASVA